MKYFALTGSISSELLDKFIEFFNSNQSEPCTLIVNSRGGMTHIGEVIAEMISEMEDCTLFIHGAYSTAFEICYYSKCKKKLSRFATGMIHMGRMDINLSMSGTPYYDEDINNFKNFEIEKSYTEELANKILTKPELKKFHKNDELWFDHKRMVKIFSNQ